MKFQQIRLILTDDELACAKYMERKSNSSGLVIEGINVVIIKGKKLDVVKAMLDNTQNIEDTSDMPESFPEFWSQMKGVVAHFIAYNYGKDTGVQLDKKPCGFINSSRYGTDNDEEQTCETLNGGFICSKHKIGYKTKCPTCAFEEETPPQTTE